MFVNQFDFNNISRVAMNIYLIIALDQLFQCVTPFLLIYFPIYLEMMAFHYILWMYNFAKKMRVKIFSIVLSHERINKYMKYTNVQCVEAVLINTWFVIYSFTIFFIHIRMIKKDTRALSWSIVIENTTKYFLEKVGWHFPSYSLGKMSTPTGGMQRGSLMTHNNNRNTKFFSLWTPMYTIFGISDWCMELQRDTLYLNRGAIVTWQLDTYIID